MFGTNYVTGHVHIFGDKGIINTVINALKNLFSASSNISATLLNFIKHIFYRDKEFSFSFKDAFINISNISKLFSEILDIRYIDNNKSKSELVLYLGLAPFKAIQACSIYDVINLPNRNIVSSLASVVKDINKVLDPLRTILNKLAEYKFINSPSEFVDSQSSGINKTK
ncbi:STREFT protein [Vibrio harveyi]|nr:STREFT protein [Vibrio harveyi]